MSAIVVIASGIVGICLLAVVFFWLLRASQTSIQGGFSILRESFDSLQQNILMSQKEFERSHDSKTASLRQELSQELQNNRKELQLGMSQSSQALDAKVGLIDAKLDKRLETLTQSVQMKLEQNLKEGFLHFEKVQEHLKQAEVQLTNLNAVGRSINDLNNLLKMPHLRGNFGEAVLERLLSDLLPTDGYELQYRVVPTSTERVDAVIKYPRCVLPIDSKFPREQILPIFETNDPIQLEAARKQLSEVMRGLARSIKEKYIHPEHGTTDMALLFVPSETLYFEILRNMRLTEEIGRLKVFVVSPNTLSITLHAVSISRSYYEMAKGMEKTIHDIKKARQHFENFEKKFEDVGVAMSRAQNAYSVAQTHLGRFSSAVTRLTGVEQAVEAISPNKLEAGEISPEV
jgi:DNA recombination protein RmuC